MGNATSLNRQGGRRYPQLHGTSACNWLPGYGTTATVSATLLPIIIDGLSIAPSIIIDALSIRPDITIDSLLISPNATF